jgi:hypothetical protein
MRGMNEFEFPKRGRGPRDQHGHEHGGHGGPVALVALAALAAPVAVAAAGARGSARAARASARVRASDPGSDRDDGADAVALGAATCAARSCRCWRTARPTATAS